MWNLRNYNTSVLQLTDISFVFKSKLLTVDNNGTINFRLAEKSVIF